MNRAKAPTQRHYTITLIVTPDEYDELAAFSKRHIRRMTLGRLYADGVLAKIREVERDKTLIAAGRERAE